MEYVEAGEPVESLVTELEALPEQLTRRMPVGEVQPRVDEQLQCGRRPTIAGRSLGDAGRQIAAGAVAADGDAARIGAELHRVLDREPERGDRIVERGRKRVLGSEPVCDREHAYA